MTINERVKEFAQFKDSAAWETYLAASFREVARDQRHACADSLKVLPAKPYAGYLQWQEAHQAIMNAEIK